MRENLCSATKVDMTVSGKPRLSLRSRKSFTSNTSQNRRCHGRHQEREREVKVVDRIENLIQHGSSVQLTVGAAIGLIFPPAVLASEPLGTGDDVPIGKLRDGYCVRTLGSSVRCSMSMRRR